MRTSCMLAKALKGAPPPKWLCSEKLDGARALWIPESRGKVMPWTTEVATGLWSRYWNVIHAPSEWLNKLPSINLDGELYLGRGKFQETMSIVKRKMPDYRWSTIKYRCYGVPPSSIFMSGIVDFGSMGKKAITSPDIGFQPNLHFVEQLELIPAELRVPQVEFSMDFYLDVIRNGGEGVMLRNPLSYYEMSRSSNLLKMKNVNDAEGVIVGFTDGEGRLEGKVGALVVETMGVTLNLAGLTDAEREPGYFKVGETVTYKYRELSDGGVPKEARYWRKR